MTPFKWNVLTGVWLEARSLRELPFIEKGLEKQTVFQIFRVTTAGEQQVGETSMSPMPGCCGIVVSHGTKLLPEWRHRGLSDAFRNLKAQIARELGYSMMIATTRMADIPAVGNFFKSRYQIVDTFVNRRTSSLIGVGIKQL